MFAGCGAKSADGLVGVGVGAIPVCGLGEGLTLCAMSVRNACRSAARSPDQHGLVDRRRGRVVELALDQTGRRHVLRKSASRAGDEPAVRVGREHRDVRDVTVDEPQAQQVICLLLHRRPGRLPVGAVRRAGVGLPRRPAAQQLAVGDRVVRRVHRVWRRNAWCEAWEVYVWLAPPTGVGVFRSDVIGGTEDAIGPAPFCARVSTMKRWFTGRLSAVVLMLWSGRRSAGRRP